MHDFPAEPTLAEINRFLAACDAEIAETGRLIDEGRTVNAALPLPDGQDDDPAAEDLAAEGDADLAAEPEPQTIDAILRALAAQATTRYPGEAARIERGLVLALNGAVTLRPDGTATVQSGGKDPEVYYEVGRGLCDCRDYERAPGGRCKHRFAVALVKKAQKLLTPPAPIRIAYHASYKGEHGQAIRDEAGHVWFQGGNDVLVELFDADWPTLHLHGRIDLAAQARVEDQARFPSKRQQDDGLSL